MSRVEEIKTKIAAKRLELDCKPQSCSRERRGAAGLLKIERDLIVIIPRADWIIYSHLLIDHGRAVCRARRPGCASCFLSHLCPSADV